VQIAKSLGADVTGVCSTGNVDLVRSIGADHVVDYTREDFTRGSRHYDFILDNVGDHSSSNTRSALTPNGTVGGYGDGRWIGSMVGVIGAAASRLWRQRRDSSINFQNREDLVVLKGLVEAGKVRPVIDRTYALRDASQAMSYVGARHARGTVVITTADYSPFSYTEGTQE
jgi:NADPH:quinone reductase-like Zn-dependent oxidoreductase